MSIKIKNISIKGIRGAKNSLVLPLNEQSILLYGENGTGKSSITDSIEWFFKGNVSHLSSGEIDLKEALRNSFTPKEETSVVELAFSRSDINCSKTLAYKNDRLTSETIATSENSNKYLSVSENENLLLRYQYLTDFINHTKGEKLKYLSDIIGFSEVTRTKEVLKRSFNSIRSEMRNQNFETQINTQKHTLIEKLGAAITQENVLFEKINEKIGPFKTEIEVKGMADIGVVLNHIKKPANNKLLSDLGFLENVKSVFTNLRDEIEFVRNAYSVYYTEFELIANNVESILQTFLAELLQIGNVVLTKKYHKSETCPLCLQPKSIDDLKLDIQKRLAKIEEDSKKKTAYDKAKEAIVRISTERIRRLEVLSAYALLQEPENKDLVVAISALRNKLQSLLDAGNLKVTSGLKPAKFDLIGLVDADFDILLRIHERIKAIEETLKKDNSAVLYADISAAKDAFLKIKVIEREREKLEIQKNTLELVYNEFIKNQKEGLENFINSLSTKIDEFYQFMNPGERFQEIRITTIGDEDELNGITIEFKFNGNWISPPQKYFSESHLNCFGISFFLASIHAFNKVNKFVILDDVISSFDTNHRQRFANLLFEKFSDYQIILLTHEQEWFRYVRQLAKRANWLINEIKWTDEKGAHLEEKPNDLKELIENSIAAGSIDFLGNPIRKYLEHRLKDICINLDVRVVFRLNEVNEQRMPDELLNELKSRINKCSSELRTKIPLIDRVANSSLLGNLLSHDNPFNPKLGDLKAFWADIIELEKLFYCQEATCRRPKVSIKNYDNVLKKIRCGCDTTKYDWKD